MTSANITHYELYDVNLNLVDSCEQHHLCVDSVSEVFEEWENKYYNHLVAMRWPDEREIDQYLTFNEIEGYDRDIGCGTLYLRVPRDLCRIDKFMKRRRKQRIANREGFVESLREELKEQKNTIDMLRSQLADATGNARVSTASYDSCNDEQGEYSSYHEFVTLAEEEAAEIGPDVRARCHIGEEGKYTKEFVLTCRNAMQARMAREAIEHFLGTGRVPAYDEPFEGEES